MLLRIGFLDLRLELAVCCLNLVSQVRYVYVFEFCNSSFTELNGSWVWWVLFIKIIWRFYSFDNLFISSLLNFNAFDLCHLLEGSSGACCLVVGVNCDWD